MEQVIFNNLFIQMDLYLCVNVDTDTIIDQISIPMNFNATGYLLITVEEHE